MASSTTARFTDGWPPVLVETKAPRPARSRSQPEAPWETPRIPHPPGSRPLGPRRAGNRLPHRETFRRKRTQGHTARSAPARKRGGIAGGAAVTPLMQIPASTPGNSTRRSRQVPLWGTLPHRARRVVDAVPASAATRNRVADSIHTAGEDRIAVRNSRGTLALAEPIRRRRAHALVDHVSDRVEHAAVRAPAGFGGAQGSHLFRDDVRIAAAVLRRASRRLPA